MRDFKQTELKVGDEVIFIYEGGLKEGIVVGGGEVKVTIQFTDKEITDEHIITEEGKFKSIWRDVTVRRSVVSYKVFKK